MVGHQVLHKHRIGRANVMILDLNAHVLFGNLGLWFKAIPVRYFLSRLITCHLLTRDLSTKSGWLATMPSAGVREANLVILYHLTMVLK